MQQTVLTQLLKRRMIPFSKIATPASPKGIRIDGLSFASAGAKGGIGENRRGGVLRCRVSKSSNSKVFITTVAALVFADKLLPFREAILKNIVAMPKDQYLDEINKLELTIEFNPAIGGHLEALNALWPNYKMAREGEEREVPVGTMVDINITGVGDRKTEKGNVIFRMSAAVVAMGTGFSDEVLEDDREFITAPSTAKLIESVEAEQEKRFAAFMTGTGSAPIRKIGAAATEDEIIDWLDAHASMATASKDEFETVSAALVANMAGKPVSELENELQIILNPPASGAPKQRKARS